MPEIADRPTTAAKPLATPALLLAMLSLSSRVSDLIFSPGSFPHVELSGQLRPVKIPGQQPLTPDDLRRIAEELIGDNKQAMSMLSEQGSCDISYRFPGKGPTGSGKSSTMAAILDRIHETQAFHIITIDDLIEFMHQHKRSIVHQRELHSDTPSFALALRAALRQASKVILVGEMRDKETVEIALEAAETGHLVLSTLHTIDASKTMERLVGVFPVSDQLVIRNRVAKSFRCIVSQRLVPRKDGSGRIAAMEILKSTIRTRESVERGEGDGKSLLDAMRDGDTEGMQHFEGEIEKLVRAGFVDVETALAYATNSGSLRLQLADAVGAPQADGGELPDSKAPAAAVVETVEELATWLSLLRDAVPERLRLCSRPTIRRVRAGRRSRSLTLRGVHICQNPIPSGTSLSRECRIPWIF